MKKVITYIFLVFSILSFSDSFNENEDERTILRKEQRLEQERIQEKYENSKDSYQKDTKIEVDKNELKFYISKINLFDDENLLNEIEKENILSKYENKKLGSTDISNILVELTNRLIEKGYVTSTASLSENNNLNSETLNLKIISGKIEKIILNEDDSLDKLKKYFLVSTKEEKVLNVRDLDTTTENFNYLEANNMTMEIIPSDKENYSIIKLKNEMKDKFTISFLTNYYTEKTKKERGKVKTNTDTSITKIEVETPKIKPVEDIIVTRTGNKELNNAINTRGAEYYLDLRAQKATAPINFNSHIINGEINAGGRAVGGHSMLGGNVRIDAYAAKNRISPNGVRNVVISVYDPSTGTWIQKVDRFGEPQLTTLFPESWTESRIIVEVDIAYKNRTCSLLDPRKWEGRTPSGIKVEGYIAPNTTVYPLQ